MRKNILIYDLDGTLVDSFPIGLQCCLSTAAYHGWIVTDATIATITDIWGAGSGRIVRACWPELEPKEFAARHKILKTAFHELNTTAVPPLFHGVAETLEDFFQRGTDQYINTGRHRPGVRRLLTIHGIAGVFTRILTSDDVTMPKPHPEGLDKIIAPLEGIGQRRHDILYVGDNYEYDRDCAEAAEIEFLAVAEAANVSRERFRKCGIPDTRIIDRFADLRAWLEAA